MNDLLPTTLALLPTTVTRWQNLLAQAPLALVTAAPAPGEWSALDCLQHLVDAEKVVFPVRVRALLAGEDFPAFDPDSQGGQPDPTQPPSVLAIEFATLRVASLKLLATLTATDLPRRARHAELGPVTLAELLHEWVAHDLMHTVQAERALMQPFIQGCGPWQVYFQDHVVHSR